MNRDNDIKEICEALINEAEIWVDDGIFVDGHDGHWYCCVCDSDNTEDRTKDVVHKEDCAVIKAEKWLEENRNEKYH